MTPTPRYLAIRSRLNDILRESDLVRASWTAVAVIERSIGTTTKRN
jgi:hypothetical protein